MKSTWLQKLIFGLLALFLLIYVGYQLYAYVSQMYRTETTYPYTISESMPVSGVVLRRETLLDARLSGVAAYTVEDGAKVSKDVPIAEVYRSEQDAQDIYKLRELAEQKENLLQAQDPGKTTYAHTDVLNKQMFGEIQSLIGQVDARDLEGFQESSDKLLSLMNTKQIATGKCENFDKAIQQLEAQENYYASKPRQEPTEITAPGPGYFIRAIDGFESLVDMDALESLSPSRLGELMTRPAKRDPSRVGKLMTDHAWYYATVIPEEDTDKFVVGRSVTLSFYISGQEPVPAYISHVNVDKEAGKSVVIYQSDYINETLVNLRVAQADVNFKNITGLRVDSRAIRYQELQRGVYVIRGEFMQFRPIHVIYEGNGYVLCKITDLDAQEYAQNLQQYDEIVVEGTELYDGKPIK